MGNKLNNYISLCRQIRQLENLIEERIKAGDPNIEFTWTSDGERVIHKQNEAFVSKEPDGSQTFTFKFGASHE